MTDDLAAFVRARLDEGGLPPRMIEALRAILARYEFACNQVAVGVVNEDAGYGPADAGWPLRADSHELDVRSLAAVWSYHPDYRQEWKPGR